MNYIKELLFPRRCAVCDEIVKFGKNTICNGCRDKFKTITEPWCLKCGKKLKSAEGEYCADCRKGNHCFTRGRAVFEYDSVVHSLYRFKYQGRQEYAEYYGKYAADFLKDEMEFRRADAIIPVPLHYLRQRKRGYNQAALVAEVISKEWNIPVKHNLIVRRKNTKPLKGFNPSQRQNNLKKAFKILQNDVKLDTIVIIDDVYTTGSTIDAMAQVLQSVGISRIYFLTLTIGRGV